jgi:4-aminobutyrate aminotransferase-like enzyme
MKEQPLIGQVRGKGLMIGVELVQDRTTKVPASAAAGFVRQYCLDHGVLIGVGGNFASVLRIQPPLVITEQQMDKTFTTVADALKAAAK